ncbi:hypothetical protein CJD36_019190 [Flavipsychrobacter stenotrophus]|uniref:Secretion system C-terminal sorting domain-containing protein n=1 Tax=Flavipsychrobacter stenotrophus TaxID=2077091 RepID=A0A2S7SRK5_9BACT|nr:T9SS type A sorting domain-containing protein [Flavipsychrobacter stenotrophus]PQJ09374.1 hypothetical protein CJD36_019190 [Flavipsychrobacter stenotrophus]
MKKISTLLTAILFSGILAAQIPNAGFETWTTTGGYDVPTGWDQLNSMTSSMSTYTCMKGTPGTVGSSYIKLVSKTVTGMGVMPGVAVSGIIDMATIKPKSGFASIVRPVSLTGSWQYMAYGSDQGHVAVLLSKWNTAMNMRDTISYTDYALPGMAMSWATFTIPLTYLTGAVPDSAIIVLSASGTTPVNSSYLYVDNLAFSGTVPTGFSSIVNGGSSFSIFPNPAKNVAIINYTSKSSQNIKVSVNDISGKLIQTMQPSVISGKNQIQVDLNSLSKGVYIIRIDSEVGTDTQKLVVE